MLYQKLISKDLQQIHSRIQVVSMPAPVGAPAKIVLPYWLLPLMYLAVYIGWGTTYLAIRVGVQSLGPATFLGLRFMIAALALLPILVLQRGWKKLEFSQVAHSAIQGILLLVGGLLPVAYAEKSLPSNITAIIIGSSPIGFAIFDRIINGTAIRKYVVIGFIFGFLGISLLSFGNTSTGAQDGVTSLGLALVILGCMTWSFASVFSKKLKPAPSPFMHVFIQYVAAGLVLTGIAFGAESFKTFNFATVNAGVWESLAYISLVPSLLSYTAYMWLIKNEPSSRVSTYAFVNPVVAVLAGALVLHETASPIVVSALCLVILGTWFNFRK